MDQLRMELLVSATGQVIEQKVDEMRESSKNNSATPHTPNQMLSTPTPSTAHQTATANSVTSTDPYTKLITMNETANTPNATRGAPKAPTSDLNTTTHTSNEVDEGSGVGLLHFATKSLRKLSNIDVSTTFAAFETSVRKEWAKLFGGMNSAVEASLPRYVSLLNSTSKGEKEGWKGEVMNGKRSDEHAKDGVLEAKDDIDEPTAADREENRLNYVMKQLKTRIVSGTQELLKKIDEKRRSPKVNYPTPCSVAETLDRTAPIIVHATAKTDGTDSTAKETSSIPKVTKNPLNVTASTLKEKRSVTNQTANVVNTKSSTPKESIGVSNASASNPATTTSVVRGSKCSTETNMADETTRSVNEEDKETGGKEESETTSIGQNYGERSARGKRNLQGHPNFLGVRMMVRD